MKKILERLFGGADHTEDLSENDDGETTGEYRLAQERLKEAFSKGDATRERLRTTTKTLRAVEPDAA